jgi:Ran GTPase-activating protein (RanGAP) involved in mRNA processing and transport
VNRIHDDNGAAKLAEALIFNNTLQSLHLEGNGIGNEGAAKLADALKVNKALATLVLRGNLITLRGAALLNSALEVNTTLTCFFGEWMLKPARAPQSWDRI